MRHTRLRQWGAGSVSERYYVGELARDPGGRWYYPVGKGELGLAVDTVRTVRRFGWRPGLTKLQAWCEAQDWATEQNKAICREAGLL